MPLPGKNDGVQLGVHENYEIGPPGYEFLEAQRIPRIARRMPGACLVLRIGEVSTCGGCARGRSASSEYAH